MKKGAQADEETIIRNVRDLFDNALYKLEATARVGKLDELMNAKEDLDKVYSVLESIFQDGARARNAKNAVDRERRAAKKASTTATPAPAGKAKKRGRKPKPAAGLDLDARE